MSGIHLRKNFACLVTAVAVAALLGHGCGKEGSGDKTRPTASTEEPAPKGETVVPEPPAKPTPATPSDLPASCKRLVTCCDELVKAQPTNPEPLSLSHRIKTGCQTTLDMIRNAAKEPGSADTLAKGCESTLADYTKYPDAPAACSVAPPSAPKRGRVRLGTLGSKSGPGEIDRSGVEKVLRRRSRAVRRCYEKALEQNGQVAGEFVVKFQIGTAGRITRIELVENGTGDEGVTACTVSRMKGWKFPAPEGGPVTFTTSFILSHDGPAPKPAEPSEVALVPLVPLVPLVAPIAATPMTPPELLTEPEYEYDKENVEEHCRAEWEERGELNKRMYRYCVRQEKKGYKNLKHLVKKRSDFQWIMGVLPLIWVEWTKRGITHYSMVHHALNREVESYLDYAYEMKQSTVNKARMNRCFAEWKAHESPWSMTMHCYKQ